MNIFKSIWSQLVATLLEKVQKIVGYNAQLKQENADLRAQLSEALANDAADEQAIADAKFLAEQAQVEAQTAKDSVAPLQAAIDADADEDEQIETILGTVIYPEGSYSLLVLNPTASSIFELNIRQDLPTASAEMGYSPITIPFGNTQPGDYIRFGYTEDNVFRILDVGPFTNFISGSISKNPLFFIINYCK